MAKHVNENYIHKCGGNQVSIKDNAKTITDMGFSDEQTIQVIKFFLFNAPVLKSDKNDPLFGLKSLREYGWVGSANISKLEGKLLKSSGISTFCFIKSDSISETLEEMNLGDKICIDHPRAVLKQSIKVTIYEDCRVEVKQQETRMECLFRHIRNSLAHNHTYLFDNGNILLEDCDDNGKISARILMPKDALIEWMKIIKKENNDQAKGD